MLQSEGWMRREGSGLHLRLPSCAAPWCTDQVAPGGAEGQGDKQTGSRGGQGSLRRRKRAALCPKLDAEESGARTEWQTDPGRSCGFPR